MLSSRTLAYHLLKYQQALLSILWQKLRMVLLPNLTMGLMGADMQQSLTRSPTLQWSTLDLIKIAHLWILDNSPTSFMQSDENELG
jgi:hypothetical protein